MALPPAAIIARLLEVLICALLCAGAQAAAGLESVRLQLKWKHQFQFAGYYAALEKGYYRQAGFDVAILEAGDGDDPVAKVVSGQSDYGIGASELALKRALGEPVVAIAAILQHSPLVLLAARGKETDVQALAGKRVMLLPHETELFAFLERSGVQRKDLQQVAHSFNVQDLVSGKVDALSAYSTDETWLLGRSGFAFLVHTPRSAGIDFYGDTLFTSERLVRADANRVEAFRDASIRGWQYAMAHAEEIAELILARYSKRHEREHLLFEAAEMRKLMEPELVEIGHMNPARWQRIAEVYAQLGMLPRGYSLEGFLFGSLTHAELARAERWLALAVAIALLFALAAAALALRNLRLRRELRSRDEAQAQLRRAEELLQARLAEIRELNARLQRNA